MMPYIPPKDHSTSNKLICILGPTATGKTKLTAQMAYQFNGEIISADSRQVYRRMNIGTGKDYEDYFVNGTMIPYHLIDIADPSEEFNLYRYNKLFYKAYDDIKVRGKLPFLAGGTGMYLHSILCRYSLKTVDFTKEEIESLKVLPDEQLKEILLSLNPNLHNTTDLQDKDRLVTAIMIARDKENTVPLAELNILTLGIQLPRNEIKKRITERLKLRLQTGMIDEVKELLDSGITLEKLLFFGLEYKYIGLHVTGSLSYNDMFQKLNSAIHNFAKKQMTWFRKMEKEGVIIHWLNGPDKDEAANLITSFIKN